MNYSALSSCEMAAMAEYYRVDHNDGSAFFFPADQGHWTYEHVDPRVVGVWSSAEKAREWIDEEITMFRDEGMQGLAGFYTKMLTEGFEEPVTMTMLEQQGRLWDGYHRTAIAMCRNETMPAFVGRR